MPVRIPVQEGSTLRNASFYTKQEIDELIFGKSRLTSRGDPRAGGGGISGELAIKASQLLDEKLSELNDIKLPQLEEMMDRLDGELYMLNYEQLPELYSRMDTLDDLINDPDYGLYARLGVLDDELDGLDAALNDPVYGLYARVDDLNDALTDPNYGLYARLDNLDDELGGLEAALNDPDYGIYVRLDGLESEQASLADAMDGLSGRMDFLDQELYGLDGRLLGLEIDLTNLEGDLGDLNSGLINLGTNLDTLEGILGNPPDSATFFSSIVTNEAWINQLVVDTGWFENLWTHNLFANRITANEILAGSITTNELNVDQITGDEAYLNKIVAQDVFTDSLATKTAFIDKLTASNAFIEKLIASSAWVEELTASNAFIDTLVSENILVNRLVGDEILAGKLTANSAFIGNLVASNVWTEELLAESAFVEKLVADTVLATKLVASDVFTDNLTAKTAFIEGLVASDVWAETITGENAFINYITSDTTFTNKLVANEAFVNTLAAKKVFAEEVVSSEVWAEDVIATTAFFETLLSMDAHVTGKLWVGETGRVLIDPTATQPPAMGDPASDDPLPGLQFRADIDPTPITSGTIDVAFPNYTAVLEFTVNNPTNKQCDVQIQFLGQQPDALAPTTVLGSQSVIVLAGTSESGKIYGNAGSLTKWAMRGYFNQDSNPGGSTAGVTVTARVKQYMPTILMNDQGLFSRIAPGIVIPLAGGGDVTVIGGGGGMAPPWEEVFGKPFSTIGTGLTVQSNQLRTNLSNLTNGTGVSSFTYDGLSPATVSTVSATASRAGHVTTGSQTFAGHKTFQSFITVGNPTADAHALNRITGDGRYLLKSNNLSDLTNAITAQSNLGLRNGTADLDLKSLDVGSGFSVDENGDVVGRDFEGRSFFANQVYSGSGYSHFAQPSGASEFDESITIFTRAPYDALSVGRRATGNHVSALKFLTILDSGTTRGARIVYADEEATGLNRGLHIFEHHGSSSHVASFTPTGLGVGVKTPSERIHSTAFIRADFGYKVGSDIVIDSNRNYTGGSGSFSGHVGIGNVSSSFGTAPLAIEAGEGTSSPNPTPLIWGRQHPSGAIHQINITSNGYHFGRGLNADTDPAFLIDTNIGDIWNKRDANIGRDLFVDRESFFSDDINLDAGQWLDDDNSFIRTDTYLGGFAGSGFQLEQENGRWNMTTDNINVRGRLQAYEFLLNQLRAGNGNEIFRSGMESGAVETLPAYTPANQITTPANQITWSGGVSHKVYGLEDLFVPFTEGELIRMKVYTGRGVKDAEATVLEVENGSSTVTDNSTARYMLISLDSGDDPEEGDKWVALGHEFDRDRQGIVGIFGEEEGAPFMRIMDGVDRHRKFGSFDTLVGQFGRLDNITDPLFSTLDGSQANEYGVWTGNVYLRENVYIAFDGGVGKLGKDAGGPGNHGMQLNPDNYIYTNNLFQLGGLQGIRRGPDGKIRFGSDVVVDMQFSISWDEVEDKPTYLGSDRIFSPLIEGGTIIGAYAEIDEGDIGNFEISNGNLIGPNTGLAGSGTWRLWVGSNTASSANFRVNSSGKLFATGADISEGKIEADNGDFWDGANQSFRFGGAQGIRYNGQATNPNDRVVLIGNNTVIDGGVRLAGSIWIDAESSIGLTPVGLELGYSGQVQFGLASAGSISGLRWNSDVFSDYNGFEMFAGGDIHLLPQSSTASIRLTRIGHTTAQYDSQSGSGDTVMVMNPKAFILEANPTSTWTPNRLLYSAGTIMPRTFKAIVNIGSNNIEIKNTYAGTGGFVRNLTIRPGEKIIIYYTNGLWHGPAT